MNWKTLFEPHILQRGRNYYQSRLVNDLYQDENSIQATVHGSSDYDVVIDIMDGEIIEMECDCPHARDGNYCKHMAAVLFSMDNQTKCGAESLDRLQGKPIGNKISDSGTIKQLVESAEEIVVRSFLSEILEKDGKLLSRFKNSISCEMSPEDIKRYKNQINNTLDEYFDSYDYMDYYSTSPSIEELEEFLNHDIKNMLIHRQYKEAFELTWYLFTKINDQIIDDFDGETEPIAEKCVETWWRIVKGSDLRLKRTMIRKFQEFFDAETNYPEEYVRRILFGLFKEEEFLREKQKFLENKIRECKRQNNLQTENYHGGIWTLHYIDLMKELREPEENIDQYIKENLDFKAVRQYYIEACIREEKYDEAIQALEDGKKLEQDAWGTILDYSLQLKELYKKTGKQKQYQEELQLLLLKLKRGNIDIFRELKTLYTREEWRTVREEIFMKLSKTASLDHLYEEEQLYDRLLDSVLHSDGLDRLMEYEKSLKKLYPDKLLNKYETEIDRMSTFTSNRDHYRELVGFLRTMKTYPNGKSRVDEIVESWNTKYRNRRAMMDELKKL